MPDESRLVPRHLKDHEIPVPEPFAPGTFTSTGNEPEMPAPLRTEQGKRLPPLGKPPLPDMRSTADRSLSPSAAEREINRQRRWVPTLADLIDRLAIVTLKEIRIPESRDMMRRERADIMHDIDLLLGSPGLLGAKELRAAMIVMLANETIWQNESRARAGGDDQDKLLKLTHSINGVRNSAKNVLASSFGDRKDPKIDCFAERLVAEFGNWNLFD